MFDDFFNRIEFRVRLDERIGDPPAFAQSGDRAKVEGVDTPFSFMAVKIWLVPPTTSSISQP
jgi:hypothetical protein